MTNAAWVGIALASIAIAASPAVAPGNGNAPGFVFPEGCCFYEGEVVRTVVPPSHDPNEGRDNFYAVRDGAEGQKGVVAVAPGDAGYHGGHWRFQAVAWNEGIEPYLLTSEAAVLQAAAMGDVTITRNAEMDFRCPIQK